MEFSSFDTKYSDDEIAGIEALFSADAAKTTPVYFEAYESEKGWRVRATEIKGENSRVSFWMACADCASMEGDYIEFCRCLLMAETDDKVADVKTDEALMELEY